MNVPNLPFLEKKRKSEYFLSLVLRDEKVSAVVFEEINGKINVVGEHVASFKSSIEDASENELLQVIDQAVSTAEKNLPEGVESQSTIFGVKETWVEEGKIKKEYLGKLKKISDELDFKPMGFLVIPEAISHLLQKEEGAPVSGILTEIGVKTITVSLIKAGKILETRTTESGESLPLTLDTLLKHFTTAEILPSRIILFNGGTDKIAQEFIAFRWSKELGFLHLPQVTNLPANFDARAVLNGAAKQMGFAVLEASIAQAEKEDGIEGEDALSLAIGSPNEKPAKESIVSSEEDKTLAEVLESQEFGFSETDVKEKDKPKTAIDEDIQSDNLRMNKKIEEIPEEVKIKTGDRRSLPVNATAIAGSMKSALGHIHFGKIIRLASSSPKKFMIGIVPVLLIFLLIIFYIFFRTATVTLGINSKETEKTENVTFSESDSTDAGKNIISAEFITVSEDGKVSTPTTGKKETGEKAKGTVTIFNNNDSAKTIPVGTVLVSSTDLKFLTDKAITVASASGDIFSGTDPGKANVSVTAEKHGTNFNLPSNTKFTVEGSSSIAAKNDDPFSGGTKKDIKVVAKADVDKLTKEIQKQLESDAKEAIKKKALGDSVVLPNFISITFDRKSFSKDVDDEANEVSLTATISYLGVSYKRSEINAYAKDKLKENIDSDMTIDEENIQVEATDIEKDKDETTAKVKIKAGLIPKIDVSEIAKEIAGKSLTDAELELNAIPEVNDIDIKVFLNLPILPKRLPFSSDKIKVVVNKNG